MNCDYHPSKKAVANCIRCEKFICAQCLVISQGNKYCNHCWNEQSDSEPKSQIMPLKEHESGKSSSYASGFWMRKAPLILLGLALAAAIVYGFVITGDRNALNTELQTVQSVLVSTQAELASTKQTLDSTRTQLNATQAELDTTKGTLASIQEELDAIQEKLRLYEETTGTNIYSDVQPMVDKPDSQGEVTLKNNPNAINRSWQNIRTFLLNDPTDDEIYQPYSFNCTNFAEMVHNNAEAAGIRTAFVAVLFQDGVPGHALNAFLTTDCGLVYIDCTGQGFLEDIVELDKFAYIIKGKDYGLISMESYFPGDYGTYEDAISRWQSYSRQLEQYNRDVEAYNAEVKEFNKEVRDFEDEVEAYEEATYPSLTWWSELVSWQQQLQFWEDKLQLKEKCPRNRKGKA